MNKFHSGILFDRQTDDIIKFFVKENVAGFGSLKTANDVTLIIMQKFIDGLNIENKQIFMNQNEFKDIVFTLDNGATITFGSYNPDGDKPDGCYITYNEENEDKTLEKSMEIYPSSFNGDNDYVYFNNYESRIENGLNNVISTEQKLFIKDEDVFDVTDASEKVAVEEPENLDF